MGPTISMQEKLDPVLRSQLEKVVAAIVAAWQVEHRGDDKHGNIHADTVSERNRSVPIGVWIPVPYNPADYTGSGGMGWTVPLASVLTFQYMLLGDTMFVEGLWNTTTVVAPAGVDLMVKIPGGYISASRAQWTNQATDAGVITPSQNRVDPDGTTLNIRRQDGANWTVAAATTIVKFHGFFAVKPHNVTPT